MIGVVYNPVAGNGKCKDRMKAFLELMDSKNVEYEYRETEYAGHTQVICQELAETCSTIIAAGGDGTMNEAITSLHGKDVRFALLPYGSGNDAAMSVYGKKCPDSVILDHILSGSDIRVDCARINDTYSFMLIATYGFGATLVKAFKEDGGSYLKVAPKIMTQKELNDYTLKINGTEKEVRTEFISVLNTGMAGGGMRIYPDSNMADGEMEVLILHHKSNMRRWMNLLALARGKLKNQPNLEVIKFKECTIISK
ncbi:MAG: hypothetical protein J6W72_00810, partial [Candidatus Methanomethylophilaceae archaeon]|nr:hypothetical protein [Candidatus Methanomethylophilaceae archaeon]